MLDIEKFDRVPNTRPLSSCILGLRLIDYVMMHLNHFIRSFETFSCLKLIYGPQQHGLMFGSSYLNHLDMSSQLGS
jgi:hypothetical protein